VVRALFSQDAVAGVFRPDGAPLTVKPALFRQIVTKTGQADQRQINAMLGTATAVFPVFRTMFEPIGALHWIPDFQHKHLPGMFDEDELARRDQDFATMAYKRRFVLLSSQAARADFERFYPDATAKVFVWPFTSALDAALTPASDPRPRHKLPAKYLFAPNQFWKHKDHLTAFRAVKLLRDRGSDVVLACTGQSADFRHPAHFAELQAFVAENGLQDSVRFLGVVPQDELLQLIRFAAGIVQPSLFEGWSTVVEDTKALGRPMILSDLDVHREQAPEASFFKRGDAENLADVIAQQWPSLSAGPDREAESAATQRKRTRDLESAEAFVGILDAMRGTP